jgi:hypothetical protein
MSMRTAVRAYAGNPRGIVSSVSDFTTRTERDLGATIAAAGFAGDTA